MSFLGLHSGTLSRLGGVTAFAFAFQGAFAAYSIPRQTEKYFDFAGSLGFVTSTLVSLFYPSFRSMFTSGPRIPFRAFDTTMHHPRQLLVSAMYLLWAGRLGSFLFQRVLQTGHDSRFEEIRKDPKTFAGIWFGQALWITIVSLPVVLINVLPAAANALSARDFIGAGVWAAGLGLEIIADSQKSAWRKAKQEKKHEEKFISSGLWSISRHPNYVGEIILQAGPPLMALSVLPPGTLLSSLVWLSPAFTYLILRYASGVPPMESAANKNWEDDKGWKEYVRDTSVLFPLPGGLGKGRV